MGGSGEGGAGGCAPRALQMQTLKSFHRALFLILTEQRGQIKLTGRIVPLSVCVCVRARACVNVHA